ncbi:hypothetical protein [Actinoallomurus iriomotensis]|uniref:Uncharacterized protein n=1 Tax=Actinoallomurus iriomotensis TaxID=478107 RepID=A0A9W6RHY2_9ACTN|nr:hypothetical protein [Actinoallomurus iriomotensis]GLY76144.1 hypothetical protein Airi01_044110 [Actinoallomurus iriomotensis]
MVQRDGWAAVRRRVAPVMLVTVTLGVFVAYRPATAGGQTPPGADPGKATSLVPNSGFDAGDRAGHPIGWAVEGDESGANIVNLSAYRTAGLGSLEVSARGTAVTVSSDRIVAAAGREYRVSAKVKGKSGEPAALSLDFTGFDGTDLGDHAAAPESSTDWRTVTVSGVAPAGTANVTVRIAAGDEGVSYWDEVNLAEAAPAYDPNLGSARELFLDDYRIASSKDVGRVVHPARKLPEPVIRPDHPWESSAYTYGSVFKIGGVYRLWYDCNNDVAPGYYLCYAESRDGRTWTKPLGRGSVGYKDIPASKTNIVIAGGGTIAYNPDAAPERRFALMQFHSGVVNQTLGYYVYFSKDGYDWTPGEDTPALLDGDVSQVTWDPRTKRYIATIKKRMFTSRTPGIYDRAAFVSTSKDFLTWSTPQLAVAGDHADDGAAEALNGLEGQIYGMPVLPYESTYVGIPWVFLTTDYVTGSQASAGAGPVLPQVASSRDLTDWSRPVRDPVIRPGDPGAWDDGALYTSSNALVSDRTVTMYYGAFNAGHGGQDQTAPNPDTYVGQTGMATWRRDGFVSLTNASTPGAGEPGELTTKPVVFHGDALKVNAVVHSRGSLTVEVLDAADDTPVPGYAAKDAIPVTGDQYAATVRWKGGRSLASLSGRQVRFRFHLTGTDLYSYWVPPAG